MNVTRFALVMVFLLAVPSTGFCQILRPFKRLDRALDALMPKLAEQAAGPLAREAVKEAFKHMFKGTEPLFELALSIQLFAQIQMDPSIIENPDKDARLTGRWIETTTPGVWGYWIGERCTAQLLRDGTVYAVDEQNMPTNRRIEPPARLPGAKPLDPILKELITKGSAKQFLSETTRFTEKMKAEKYSKPVLAKMYFEAEDKDVEFFVSGWEPGEISSNPIFKRDGDKLDRNSAVSSFYSVRKKDAKQTNPLTLRCSFVFVTMNGG